MLKIDLHTHSIASGHGTNETLTDMAKAASSKGIALLGVSDHAPAMLGAAKASYFRNLRYAVHRRFDVNFLYGTELSVLSGDGAVDLPDDILAELDYAIASLHRCGFKKHDDPDFNTRALIGAMRHPNVCMIGHPDDTRFPINVEALVAAAKEHHVLLEINNSSLTPGSFRGNAEEVDCRILASCAKHQVPVIIGSDSHGSMHLGDDRFARALIEQIGFPSELIANEQIDLLRTFVPSVGRIAMK